MDSVDSGGVIDLSVSVTPKTWLQEGLGALGRAASQQVWNDIAARLCGRCAWLVAGARVVWQVGVAACGWAWLHGGWVWLCGGQVGVAAWQMGMAVWRVAVVTFPPTGPVGSGDAAGHTVT